MEDQSEIDISIRNVSVRLNDSNINSEMNGRCGKSLYLPPSVENESQNSHYNAVCEDKCLANHSDVANDLENRLHESGGSLLNGCNKRLHDEIQNLGFSNLSIDKTNSVNLRDDLRSNQRTCLPLPINTAGDERTENELCDLNSENKSFANQTTNSKSICDNLTASLQFDTKHLQLVPPEFCYGSEHLVDKEFGLCSSEEIFEKDGGITYVGYESERQMPDIMRLIQKDLSEPYSIYTYRYFIHNWPKLCFLAQEEDHCVGAIVCKLDVHKKQSRRGYIAMLAVDEKYRKRKIGSNLVLKAINAMVQDHADEVVLETEITNKSALRLYENLGFVRDKRLFRYYLNGVDALRLKLWLK